MGRLDDELLLMLMGGSRKYYESIKQYFSSDILAYIPDTKTGLDITLPAYNGTPTAITEVTGIGDGLNTGHFDGSTSYLNMYTAALQNAIDLSEITFSVFMKIPESEWTSGSGKVLLWFVRNAENLIYMQKASTNNSFTWGYTAGAVAKGLTSNAVRSANWMNFIMTASLSTNLIKYFVNGVLIAQETSLGTWSGLLSTVQMLIGSTALAPSGVLLGDIAHVMILKRIITDAEAKRIALLKYVNPDRTGGVLITFDDGGAGIINDGYSYLQPLGIKATVYATTGSIGGAGMMTWENLQTLDAAGWSIAQHTATHPNLTTLTEAQQEAEFTTARDALITNSLPDAAHHVAYPGGFYNADTLTAMAATGMLTGRLAETKFAHPKIGSLLTTNSQYVAADTTFETVITAIENNYRRNGYSILVFHNLAGTLDWTAEQFQTLINWLISNNIPMKTIEEYYAEAIA